MDALLHDPAFWLLALFIIPLLLRVPIALALGGADMSFRSPMAVAVIGGLITSTVLSLLVVPAVFTYVDDFAQWLRHRVLRRPHAREAQAGEARAPS